VFTSSPVFTDGCSGSATNLSREGVEEEARNLLCIRPWIWKTIWFLLWEPHCTVRKY